MTSANAMRLKLYLKDDPLLQEQLCRCESPEKLIAIVATLKLQVSMADLLRMEAQMTLTLDDEQLMKWYETPYWQRVLISIGAMPLGLLTQA
jgi:hypothetical protein